MSQDFSTKGIARRDFLRLGAAATAVSSPLGCAFSRAVKSPGKSKQPNIIFVFSDEHRWSSLPFTEMPEVIAPNMIRLAQEGMRFDNCCSTSPICTPYRGMLITGMWPHQSGYVSNDYMGSDDDGDKNALNPAANLFGGNRFFDANPGIADTFKDAGYVTGYVGKWHLDEESVYGAGFDYHKNWLYGDDHWTTQVRDVPSHEPYWTYKGYNAIGMTDQALEFVGQQAGGEKPFFLMLSINPPHWQWDDAPEEFVKLYPESRLPRRPNVTDPKYKEGNEKLYYQHYHAHITAVDHQLGRLMDAVKNLGLDENTVIVYTSDHGSSFGSNGVSSKANPFDEAIRVPFIVRWPGRVPAGQIADSNLGTMDIYPTLCGLAGIIPPDFCGGQDLSAIACGRPGPDPASQFIAVNSSQRNYFRAQIGSNDGQNLMMMHPFRGVRTKRYTYVVNAEGDWLLYDNRNDPYQLKNLVDDPACAGVKEELRKELTRWLAKAEDPFIPPEWRSLPIPERIAVQNRHYTLLPYRKQLEQYKAGALAPYLSAATAEQKIQLCAAADRIYDESFFGLYKALHRELNGGKRNSRKPLEELRKRLDEHEQKYAVLLKDEAGRIIRAAL
jgi:arylsulfatase A-like enzyme